MEKQISGHSEPSEGPVDKEDGSLLKKENGKSVEAGAQAQSAPAAPAGAVNGGAAGGVGPPADILLLDHLPARDQWSTKVDFLLSCVGFAVGLGNVWRFPYLCYKNGGGAFLIPYLICLVCGGMPVFFMEIALGQYTARGGLAAWKICPAFQGIGIATTVIVFLMNIYYIVILAWDLYYASMAFQNPLPWSHCNNPWNTDRCMVSSAAINCTHILASESSASNTSLASNITQEYISPAARLLCESRAAAADNATLLGNVTANITAKAITTVDPVVEFWENKILQISSGIDEPGGIVWQLALSLFIVWLCCYFCVWKGVKWTGKIVYFTATFPYVMLTILLVRGVTLEGAWDGLEFYLKPDFSRLGDAQVWIDGGTQIFFSYAIALGIITALGSYNKFHNNCYKDAVVVACINSFTSLYAGVVVFSVLGFMAHEQGVSIHDVAESGPGLAFIAYPKAVTQMPMSPLWAVMFFFMIILIGVDSQFVGVEGFVTVFMDLFPSLRKGYNKEIFIACYCIVSFLIGLTMVTNGGMYVFQIFDYYAASGMSLLWVCFFECVAIAWVYGGENFYDNIETMIGFRINCWFRICWTYITPTITMGILVFMLVSFKPLTYNQTYEYPLWAQGLGMSMAFSSMLCIPAFFVLKLLTTKGDTLAQRWQKMSSPTSQMLLELKRNIWLSRNDTPSSSGTPDDSVTPDKGGTPESGKKLWSGGSGTPQHHAATGVRHDEKVPLHDAASPV